MQNLGQPFTQQQQPYFSKTRLSDAVLRTIHQLSFPRVQMSFFILLTGAFGLLCSYVMLQLGAYDMVWRYPLAVVMAYAFFLFLLWVWLRVKVSDILETVDITGLPQGRGTSSTPIFEGNGGEFGGGGASGSFDAPTSIVYEQPSAYIPLNAKSSTTESAAGGIGGDELMLVLLAIASIFAIAYVVYIAPVLFAELLLDGTLCVALFKRTGGEALSQHWLQGVIKRTLLPFLITALLFTAMAWYMDKEEPEASSIGHFINLRK